MIYKNGRLEIGQQKKTSEGALNIKTLQKEC